MEISEKQLNQTYIYQGKVINLRRDEVILPNQKHSFREVVEHRGGVGVLAIQDNQILMVKQFRYPYQEVLYEIPAGKLEKGEKPYDTGLRELEEETGAVAITLIPLGKLYPSPGYTNEIIHLFYTTSFTMKESHLDDDEFLSVEKIKIKDVYKMIENGKIVDAKTIIAVLKYQLLNRKEM